MLSVLRLCTALLAAWLGAGPLAAADGFTILQINDAYKIEGLEAGRSGGLARLRALRRAIELEEGRPVLVLHGGDLLFPSVMSKFLDGEAMIAVLNLLDGDPGFDRRLFVTFGNHEFDHRDLALLEARLAQSRFTWLSANLALARPGDEAIVPFAASLPNVAAEALFEIGGVRVGIFGLTMPGEPRPWLVPDLLAERIEKARAAARRLRDDGAEWVVALTHQEMAEDAELAAAVPEIDRVVGGHEHVALERRVGETWITKADADVRSIVRIDVDREADGLRSRHEFVAADEALEPDAEMLGEVARWLTRLDEAVRARRGRRLLDIVATTEHALEGVEPAIRGRETALGNFLADVLRARLRTDVGLLNGGAVRVNDDIPAGGALRVYELEGIFSYDNRPVASEISGAELLELLRVSVAGASQAQGRFLQVSGLRFRYHVAVGDDEQVSVEPDAVEVLSRDDGRWRRLELERRYSVATLDYLWANGCREGYRLLADGCGGKSPPLLPRPEISWRGITEEAIAALPGRQITTRIEGRIERLEEPSEGGAK